MGIWHKRLTGSTKTLKGRNRNLDQIPWRQTWKYAVVLATVIVFLAEFGTTSFAQRTSPTSSKSGFIVYGDVKVDLSRATDAQQPSVLDVLLYTKGNQLFARQRIGPNGRYRFYDVFDGDYYIVIEVENQEVSRVSVFISPTSPTEIKQDIELELRPIGAQKHRGIGVVSAADIYDRSAQTDRSIKDLEKEIDSKNYVQALATLRQVVESDPKDFPAWSDLGMIYLVVQKDYEAAEKVLSQRLNSKARLF